MKTKVAALYGEKDIRIREFELPKIGPKELLVKVISNSLCLSTYKAAKLGVNHKRVPNDIADKPIITGHEFAGIIVEVGKEIQDKFKVDQKFVLQPAMGLESGYSAGYSYEYFGGNATYCIISELAIEKGCVLPHHSEYFADASLAEPMSCIIGAYNASYHTKQYVYKHDMGIKKGGKLALLGCAGPMGLGAIDYAINGPINPSLIVVTDIDEERLNRAQSLLSVEKAKEKGIKLVYLNTSIENAIDELRMLSDNTGYDDVFVYAASKVLLEQADAILGYDGCLNFFAGPTDKTFSSPFNFYNVHYESTHIVGTSGGSIDDMLISLDLSNKEVINPSYMLTHIGGLNAAPDAILNLPNLPGGKKIIYPHTDIPLVAIEDFDKQEVYPELFKILSEICKANNNVWNLEAEKYLLDYFEN